MESTNHPLDVAAAAVGDRAAFAKALNVTYATIGNWKSRGTPVDRCIDVEKLSRGAVTCEQLRPDIDWGYLRGTPQGTSGGLVVEGEAANA